MRVLVRLILLLGFPLGVICQETQENSLSAADSLYREDQFYLGFTYNILTDMPSEVVATGFSGGMHAGFIRDFPFNQRRNIGMGLGLGWSLNDYGHNLFIGEDPGSEESTFQVLDDRLHDYDKNRFSFQSIDVPLQFRWRTSTTESHRFWRVYTGVRFGYVYYLRSNFEQPGNIVRQTKIPEFNRFRLGATFTFGYNTFNFHFYYNLIPFFNDEANLQGEQIGMGNFQVGLMFYIL